jgi:AraC-like DNA-binding protein
MAASGRLPRSGQPLPAQLGAEMLQRAVEAGADARALLAQTRLPYSLDDLTCGRVAALSRIQFAEIYRVSIGTFHADLQRRHRLVVPEATDFALQCYSILDSRSLGEAITRSVAFQNMLQRYERAEATDGAGLAVADGIAAFTLRSARRADAVSELMVDLTTLSILHRLYSWLVGKELEVVDADSSYPALLSADLAAYVFRRGVRFGQPRLGGVSAYVRFAFPARMLDLPPVRAAEELRDFLPAFPFDMISSAIQADSLADTVKTILGAALARAQPLPNLRTLAHLCNLSTATLRRRLAEEGTSVGAIKEECRRDLAVELLRQPGMSLEQIAGRLDFSDARNFRRAFKAWTGHLPSELRR